MHSTLSPEEVEKAIRSLPAASWVRLNKVAKAYSRRGVLEADDLLQKALIRALDGSRLCPADVDVVRFLAEAMRSIASDAMDALSRQPEFQPLIGEDGLPIDVADSQPNAETRLVGLREAKRIAAAVLNLFAGDEIAEIMVIGIIDGMDGEELRDLTGLDKTAFASKRRFIRRRIDEAFPNGWKP